MAMLPNEPVRISVHCQINGWPMTLEFKADYDASLVDTLDQLTKRMGDYSHIWPYIPPVPYEHLQVSQVAQPVTPTNGHAAATFPLPSPSPLGGDMPDYDGIADIVATKADGEGVTLFVQGRKFPDFRLKSPRGLVKLGHVVNGQCDGLRAYWRFSVATSSSGKRYKDVCRLVNKHGEFIDIVGGDI